MVNPIILEVISNALRSVAEQMTATMVRSSYSTIVKEMMDCSSAIFDDKGQIVAEGANIPIHLNSLGPALNTILSHYFPKESLKPGDIIITNHPYIGGGSSGSHHTKDLIMIAPIFQAAQVIGFSATMLHHRDIGGVWSGDSWTVEIWQEGLLIQPVKLYDNGKRDEAVLNLMLSNNRVPRDMLGDLMAQVSGCKVGVRGVTQLVDKYGLEQIREVTEELLNYSERRMRAEIETIPDGEYTHQEYVLDDGYKGGPYELKVKITVAGSDIIVDYTGSHAQIAGPINSPLSATYSATYYTMKAITNPTIPSNEGCNRPITIIAPEKSLVNCAMPVGCFQRMVTDHILVDLIMGALATGIPEKVMADSCGCMYNFCSAQNLETHAQGGEVDHRQYWGEVVPGGLGARAMKDGVSVMSCHVTNCPIPPIEATEIEAPVLFLEREFIRDSGGAGQFRGGLGQVVTYKIMGHDARLHHTSQKAKIPPQGMLGGRPGTPVRWIINQGTPEETTLTYAMDDVTFLGYGDTVSLFTPGGGGYGNPIERDISQILKDVRKGLVSVESARQDYGVVIDPETNTFSLAGLRTQNS